MTRICEDPAHFQSKVLAAQDMEEWARYGKEMAQNPPVKRTEMEAALDLYREMGAGLRAIESENKAASAKPRSKECRHARKSVEPKTRRDNTATRGVQSAESTQPEDTASPAAASATPLESAPSEPAPLAPDSGPSAVASPGGADQVIKAIQG